MISGFNFNACWKSIFYSIKYEKKLSKKKGSISHFHI